MQQNCYHDSLSVGEWHQKPKMMHWNSFSVALCIGQIICGLFVGIIAVVNTMLAYRGYKWTESLAGLIGQ
jgi:hypothetical protein